MQGERARVAECDPVLPLRRRSTRLHGDGRRRFAGHSGTRPQIQGVTDAHRPISGPIQERESRHDPRRSQSLPIVRMFSSHESRRSGHPQTILRHSQSELRGVVSSHGPAGWKRVHSPQGVFAKLHARSELGRKQFRRDIAIDFPDGCARRRQDGRNGSCQRNPTVARRERKHGRRKGKAKGR